jgi:DNA-binding response OmpR family regulator
MRYPQLLVYEMDGRLAVLLRDLTEERKWSLRETRRSDGVLRLLSNGGPTVLVLKLSADRNAELTLLHRVSWLFPETAVIVVLDAETAGLAGLAWDLGASYVLMPTQDRELLLGLVGGLMGTLECHSPRDRPGAP